MIVNLIHDENKTIEFDSGFYFGKGIFETILVIDKPIFLKEHVKRLNNGLKEIGIKKNISEELVLENIGDLEKCALKIMASEKNIVFSKRKLSYINSMYDEGFKLKISNVRRNEYSKMVYLKSFNYMDNILEREKALEEGYNECLFMNTKGDLTEGSVSNLFIIMEDCIITPSVDCGLLNGVVRQFIIKKLKERYNIKEGSYSIDILKKCKGAFLTNSLMGVMWVNEIDNITFQKSKIYDEIRKYYEESIYGTC